MDFTPAFIIIALSQVYLESTLIKTLLLFTTLSNISDFNSITALLYLIKPAA